MPVESYHRAKTGALFVAAVTSGAISAGADPGPWRILGEKLGAAYQVADDLLDAVCPEEECGKPTGRDAALARPSLVAELGLAGAYARLEALVEGGGRRSPLLSWRSRSSPVGAYAGPAPLAEAACPWGCLTPKSPPALKNNAAVRRSARATPYPAVCAPPGDSQARPKSLFAPIVDRMRLAWIAERNRLLTNAKFQRWAADFPLTRGVARERARGLFDLVAGVRLFSDSLDLRADRIARVFAGRPPKHE